MNWKKKKKTKKLGALSECSRASTVNRAGPMNDELTRVNTDVRQARWRKPFGGLSTGPSPRVSPVGARCDANALWLHRVTGVRARGSNRIGTRANRRDAPSSWHGYAASRTRWHTWGGARRQPVEQIFASQRRPVHTHARTIPSSPSTTCGSAASSCTDGKRMGEEGRRRRRSGRSGNRARVRRA